MATKPPSFVTEEFEIDFRTVARVDASSGGWIKIFPAGFGKFSGKSTWAAENKTWQIGGEYVHFESSSAGNG